MSMYPPVQRTMVRLLSPPRMSTYLAGCEDDVSRAVDLYRWNLDVSMAFFESLHYLEVAVRNRVDESLSAWVGPGTDWLDPASAIPLAPGTRARIAVARDRAARGGRPVAHGHVVAELTFGFWPSLLSDAYNRTLWQPALKAAFPRARRTDLRDRLLRAGTLRNRVAHHEPVFSLDLGSEHEQIITVAELVEPRLGWWIDATSRTDAVLRRRPA
ncbi:hypothetical protein [Cellulomonas triticagri]|uniref:Abi family protein n=1 Tax=Cellulomonas triticagri TaxID=2483352 RepID=A0A3M2JGG9_9CELL|nr:hypothetical protein [Cellulomonas triticagri]RMI13127.1 hypothetical protein EBM89_05575 [Cellulomonas triticagri]